MSFDSISFPFFSCWCLDLDGLELSSIALSIFCRFDLLYKVDFSTCRAILSHSPFHLTVYRLTVNLSVPFESCVLLSRVDASTSPNRSFCFIPFLYVLVFSRYSFLQVFYRRSFLYLYRVFFLSIESSRNLFYYILLLLQRMLWSFMFYACSIAVLTARFFVSLSFALPQLLIPFASFSLRFRLLLTVC